jgi:hypothetical protein
LDTVKEGRLKGGMIKRKPEPRIENREQRHRKRTENREQRTENREQRTERFPTTSEAAPALTGGASEPRNIQMLFNYTIFFDKCNLFCLQWGGL